MTCTFIVVVSIIGMESIKRGGTASQQKGWTAKEGTDELTNDIHGINWSICSKGIQVEAPQSHPRTEAMKQDQWHTVRLLVQTHRPHMRLLLPYATPNTHISTPVTPLQIWRQDKRWCVRYEENHDAVRKLEVTESIKICHECHECYFFL